jgi:hypothetical protein
MTLLRYKFFYVHIDPFGKAWPNIPQDFKKQEDIQRFSKKNDKLRSMIPNTGIEQILLKAACMS